MKHVVLLDVNSSTPEEKIVDMYSQLSDIADDSENIQEIKAGRNTAPDDRSYGFNHGFIVTLDDSAAEDFSDIEPLEKLLQDFIHPLCNRVLIYELSTRGGI